METSERVAGIIAALKQEYPDALCALHYGKDYELMIAVRLSAQCTDARVNLVTPALFARYPTLDAFAEADVAEVETYVHSCGFYKHKSYSALRLCASQKLVRKRDMLRSIILVSALKRDLALRLRSTGQPRKIDLNSILYFLFCQSQYLYTSLRVSHRRRYH